MKTDKLIKFSPCREALMYIDNQESPELAWQNCERGDWMLWIAKKLNVDDRKLTIAKAMIAKQVQHLMKDERSITAINASLRYANGEITRKELNIYAADAADAAADAADAADAAAEADAYAAAEAEAEADAYAAYAAADAADAAADAYAAAAYADAAAEADAYVKTASLKRSADICREYLTEEVLNTYNTLK